MAVAVGMTMRSREQGARVALARRFESCLDACTSKVALSFEDTALVEAVSWIEQGNPGPGDVIVARCLDAVTALLHRPADRRTTDSLLDLLADLHELDRSLSDMSRRRHHEQMAGIRMALHRLRGAEATTQIIEQAVRELCENCGFDRCAAFRMEESGLVVQAAYFSGQDEWASRWRHFSEGHPAQLQPQDVEVELVRRQIPILAAQPQRTAKGMAGLVRSAETESYVAAPIVSSGRVVGTLHADNLFSGRPLDESHRDALGAFAEGFAFALERAALIEGIRQERRRVQQLMAAADSGLQELGSGGIDFQRGATGEMLVAPKPAALASSGTARLASLLTARELEVVELMAAGATNAVIADRLVISGATVKTHVKHILRKLRAANRAEAVSKVCRITQSPPPELTLDA